MRYGIAIDYDYSATHKRQRLTVWSGPFASVWEADALSLPKNDGYMLTTYTGNKVRVTCPAPRDDENYREVDRAISDALETHYNR